MFERRFFKKRILLFTSFVFLIVVGIYIYHNYFLQLTIKHTKVGQQTKKTSEIQSVKGAQTKAEELSRLQIDLQSKRHVYLGMWTQGFWDTKTNRLYPEKLTAIEDALEKHMAIAHYYRGWEALASPEIVNELNVFTLHKWRPLVSVNPYFFDGCRANGLNIYAAIAKGNCDEFLRKAAENLKAFSHPLFLRFAWEMNLVTTEWGVNKTASTPTEFVSAWRHMHDIFYNQGATNVLFVFAPNVEAPDSIPFKELYPGDTYVEWIGLDGYNWGTTQSWSIWQSFQSIFQKSYDEITLLAPTKPLMISEVNSSSVGGSKTTWLDDMLTVQVPLHFPQIKALVLYNEDRTAAEGVDWLIVERSKEFFSLKKDIAGTVYDSEY